MTPPMGELIIDGGNKYTNHPTGMVKLQIKHDEDVMGMQLTNVPDFEQAKLLPLEENIENWKLEGDNDGAKTVFVRLKDKAGNFSKVYAAGIILDRIPPANCELIINNNDPFVRNKNKRVALSLRGEGASQMMVSNQPSMENATWEPFKTAIAWTLEGPEGEHQVFVKFRDSAGNDSEVISKTINSDYTPPKVISFMIDGGAEFCNNPQNIVNLSFNVEGAVSMAISNQHLNDTSSIGGLWEKYQSGKEWKLDGEDGYKMVFCRFKDEAGNVTTEINNKIILDKVPPTEGKIGINNGAAWFTDKTGKGEVSLFARGAHEMMLSNNSDFKDGKWGPMSAVVKDWIFNTSQPTTEVFARFRDKAGNVSEAVSASAQVDMEAPKNPAIVIDNGAKYVNDKNRKIQLSLSAEGATGMRISQHSNFADAQWEPIMPGKEIILSEEDGAKTYFAQFSDDAGNYSEVAKATIILDTTPPKFNAFTINKGELWTNDEEKKVSLFIEAEGASHMMISANPEFEQAQWEEFKPQLSNFVLPGEDGEKVLYIRLKDEQGNQTGIATAKINLKRSF